MSDASGGPGWWLANDGKWYPPPAPWLADKSAGKGGGKPARPVFRRWWFLTGIGLALLIIIGGVAGGSKTPKTVATAPSHSPTTAAVAATAPPTTQPPATEPPTTEAPTTEPPSTEPPATEPPATEPPPTTLPVVAASNSCSASMTNDNPPDGGYDTVNISSSVPDASVTIYKHYRTTTSTDSSYTNAQGSASITFNMGSPTPGYTVEVDVNINNGQSTCSTSFTPQ